MTSPTARYVGLTTVIMSVFEAADASVVAGKGTMVAPVLLIFRSGAACASMLALSYLVAALLAVTLAVLGIAVVPLGRGVLTRTVNDTSRVSPPGIVPMLNT